MNTRLLALLASAALALFTTPARAQVPQILNYQGRVAVGSPPVNFNGAGQFKFALVSTNGTTTYWSNDGTSTAGSQPTAAVALTVTNGLYAVLLGDSALANMTAVPASVFTNSDVRLRVWFHDGTNGWQLLAPDQRLAAVGYAYSANSAQTVVDGAITSTKLATGAVGAAQLAPGLTLAGTTSGSFSGPLAGNATSATTAGSATTATTAGSFTGSLAGDVTGTQSATVVAKVGGVTAANVAAGANLANAATNANTASTLVKRDAGGSFAAGSITLAGGITLPTTAAGASVGAIVQNGTPILHTLGTQNVAVGAYSGSSITSGLNNTVAGYNSMPANSTGSNNTALGSTALWSNTTGNDNTAIGYNCLVSNVGGYENTALGGQALQANLGGSSNVASGRYALESNTSGSQNTGLGHSALISNTTGAGNIAIGFLAGSQLTSGNHNIDIDHPGVAAEAATIRIGTPGTQTRSFIAGIRGVTTGSANASAVLIDSNGQLGTVSSSQRYKEDIAEMGAASARLLALRPVTFRYKQAYDDGAKPIQFGLIAEEVAETFPELAVYNDQGQPETVKYQDLPPLLLNEFLKEHRRVDELAARQEAEVRQLREENAALKKRLGSLESAVMTLVAAKAKPERAKSRMVIQRSPSQP